MKMPFSVYGDWHVKMPFSVYGTFSLSIYIWTKILTREKIPFMALELPVQLLHFYIKCVTVSRESFWGSIVTVYNADQDDRLKKNASKKY